MIAFFLPLSPAGGLFCEALDKEFYNDYLDSLPNKREKRKKTLERNLLYVVKKIVPREDPLGGPAHVGPLAAKDLAYKKVTVESAFVRGIIHELPYLKPTPWMWIVKSGDYMVFITFRADPRKYIMSEYQTRTVIKRKKKGKSEHKEVK